MNRPGVLARLIGITALAVSSSGASRAASEELPHGARVTAKKATHDGGASK